MPGPLMSTQVNPLLDLLRMIGSLFPPQAPGPTYNGPQPVPAPTPGGGSDPQYMTPLERYGYYEQNPPFTPHPSATPRLPQPPPGFALPGDKWLQQASGSNPMNAFGRVAANPTNFMDLILQLSQNYAPRR